MNLTEKTAVGNSTFKKLAIQLLNIVFCFVSTSMVAESFRLRNATFANPENVTINPNRPTVQTKQTTQKYNIENEKLKRQL